MSALKAYAEDARYVVEQAAQLARIGDVSKRLRRLVALWRETGTMSQRYADPNRVGLRFKCIAARTYRGQRRRERGGMQ